MYLQEATRKCFFFFIGITEIRGSGIASRSGSEFGSISQRHVSVDPDPDQHQNVIDPDPEHCPKKQLIKTNFSHLDARFF
jgi:hypothetical protein